MGGFDSQQQEGKFFSEGGELVFLNCNNKMVDKFILCKHNEDMVRNRTAKVFLVIGPNVVTC